jgi:uroporphyrinogen decarboxylase
MADLIEVGVDILNALQPTAVNMDLKKIKDTFGSQAALFGGLDTQGKIPFGSLDDVEQEVKRALMAVAPRGGYILAGAHNIQPDTSMEKLVNIFEWAKTYGTYPLQKYS